MKKIYLFTILFTVSSTLLSQSMGYTDLSVLFSQENYNGTARYNAMSGAFGALGGEVSSIYQNPAGGGVFAKSEISGSYSYSTINTDATYYENTSFNTNNNSLFPQFGMVLVFNSPYASSDWTKFTLGFNYSVINNFNNHYYTKGNNETFARYSIHPYDENIIPIPYGIAEEQNFENFTEGKSDVFTLSLSSAYKDFFYIGSSLNFHTIEFQQETYLTELNSDSEGHTLTANYLQFIEEYTTGISLGVGIIMKPFRNIRLGIAYQSPIWNTEVYETSNAIDYDRSNSYTGFEEQGYLDITSDSEGYYENTRSYYPEILNYQYSLNTPEKWTASAAITLGQHGLISADYYRKNYSLIKISNGFDFEPEMDEINNLLTTADGIRAGAELRFNQISLRGGAHFEESPYKGDENEFYKRGYSAGLGMKFNQIKLDLAYQYTEQNDNYSIYNISEGVEDISIVNSNSRITTTLTIVF